MKMNDKMLQEHEKQINRTYKLICEQTDIINLLSYIYVNDKHLYSCIRDEIMFNYNIIMGGK